MFVEQRAVGTSSEAWNVCVRRDTSMTTSPGAVWVSSRRTSIV